MTLTEFEVKALSDRLEGWELVEFLQLSIQDILDIAQSEDWINEDNIDEVLEFAGIKEDD